MDNKDMFGQKLKKTIAEYRSASRFQGEEVEIQQSLIPGQTFNIKFCKHNCYLEKSGHTSRGYSETPVRPTNLEYASLHCLNGDLHEGQIGGPFRCNFDESEVRINSKGRLIVIHSNKYACKGFEPTEEIKEISKL